MKTLNEVLIELLKQEIRNRSELRRRSEEDRAKIKAAEEMAEKDALVLIEQQAGFKVDGWRVEASYSNTSDDDDYFTVSLVQDSDHGFSHRVDFTDYLVIDNMGQPCLSFGKMDAFHITNEHGMRETLKGCSNLLEALVFAEHGDIFGLVGEAFDRKAARLLESLGEGASTDAG